MINDLDFQKKATLKLHIRKFFLFPEYWRDNQKHIPYLLEWKKLKFNSGNLKRVPEKKGIYCFIVKPYAPNFFENSYLFYVGQTKRTLKIRFKEYLDNQAGKGKPRIKVFEMLNLYAKDIYFCYTPLSTGYKINKVEENLLNTFMPPINAQIPNAKINPILKYIYE